MTDHSSRISDEYRKIRIREVLNIASKYIMLDHNIELMAKNLIQRGMKAMDSLHVASAINYGVDYFCTVDDSLLKKAKNIETATKMTSPLDLLMEIVK